MSFGVFPIPGWAGVKTARRVNYRYVFQGQPIFADLPGGLTIDGSQSRDPGNTTHTTDIDVLRAGLLMGKITSATFGTVGCYAPSIIGVTTGAYTSGGTTLTVSAAQATELARIAGQSGTAELVCIGPPSAAGTVAVTAFDHSAINTTTGDITVTSLGVNKIAGSFICINDGRYTPLSFIPDGYGINVTDRDGSSVMAQWSNVPIAGTVISSQLINWPSDTSLIAWIQAALNGTAGGQFVFTTRY